VRCGRGYRSKGNHKVDQVTAHLFVVLLSQKRRDEGEARHADADHKQLVGVTQRKGSFRADVDLAVMWSQKNLTRIHASTP